MGAGVRFEIAAAARPLAVGDHLDAGRGPFRVLLTPSFGVSLSAREHLTVAMRRAAVSGQAFALDRELDDPTSGGAGEVQLNVRQLQAMHRRLAVQLGALDGFEAEEPSRWHDGFNPAPVGTLGQQQLRRGDLDASCIALLELHDGISTVRAVVDVPVVAPFDRSVLLVAIPAGAEPAALTVVAGGEDLATSTFLAVETGDGLRVATSRQLGVRYRNGHIFGTDLHLADTARQAVFQILVEQIPVEPAVDREALHRQTEWLQQESERIGALVWDRRVWTTRPVQVDGATFALFTTSQQGRTAAVLDLGYARVSITSDTVPDDLALTMVPADAFRWR